MRLLRSIAARGHQWVLVMVPLLLLSCGREISISELVGVYSLRLPGGIEKLTLNDNGSFVQEIAIDGQSQKHLAKGTWKYNAIKRHLIFDEHFMVALDARGQLKNDFRANTKRIVLLQAERFGRAITLIASEDTRYRKQNTASP